MIKIETAGLDVETKQQAAGIERREPANYLVIGDFGSSAEGVKPIDRDTLDGVLDIMGVRIGDVPIREIEDFHPDRLYQRLEAFDDLRESEQEARPSPTASPERPDLPEILQSASLLDQIVEGRAAQQDPFERFLHELSDAYAVPATAPDKRRADALNERMRALLHQPRFQALESAWRGIDFVVGRMDDEFARVYIAQYSREDLTADLTESTDLASTRFHSLLRAHEWGGIFGLYAFGGSSTDIEALGRIALLAATARAPFVAEGSADMGQYWEELRSIPEASYLGLTMPRLLLRLPYGSRTGAIDSFEFEEMPSIPLHSEYLWGSPALACLAMSAGAPEETENSELCGLPLHTFQNDGEWKSTPCAEVLMTESQVEALIGLGMIPLVSYRGNDRVRIAGLRAINGTPLPLR